VLAQSTRRHLTQYERKEATKIFGTSLDLNKIWITHDPKLKPGGAEARRPDGLEIAANLPSTNSSDYIMAKLIHEMAHTWQYQHYTKEEFDAKLVPGDYNYGWESGLNTAKAAGKGLDSFNLEEQAAIVDHYYQRMISGKSTAAWLPFAQEVMRP
jgi:hypothetical protein